VTAVLDASAAVRQVVDPSGAPEIYKLVGQAELVLAPELFVAETANAFWKYLRAGRLTREQCELGLGAALELVDDFVPLEPLASEAFDLAATMGRPVYDVFYLVLARRNGAILATADRQLLHDAAVLGVRTLAQIS
jgi:predicted nucleic acid-binding protein